MVGVTLINPRHANKLYVCKIYLQRFMLTGMQDILLTLSIIENLFHNKKNTLMNNNELDS